MYGMAIYRPIRIDYNGRRTPRSQTGTPIEVAEALVYPSRGMHRLPMHRWWHPCHRSLP